MEKMFVFYPNSTERVILIIRWVIHKVFAIKGT